MEEPDRISKLTNPILHHILSFIDIKSVVQTSILSKRWRYVWNGVSILEFSSEKFYDSSSVEKLPTFINFVDKVLSVKGSSDIKKFSLYWGNVDSDTVTEHLNRWIPVVLGQDVQELSVHIDVSHELKFILPQCLFISASLVKLVLKFTSKVASYVTLPGSIRLPNLKSLTLGSFCTDDVNLVDKILSGCPILESLVLRDFRIEASDHPVTVNIESGKLKHLEIINNYAVICPRYIMAKIIKLNAPNLTSFICKDLMLQEYLVENLCSLISADIEMVIEDETNVVEEELQKYLIIKEGRKELYPKRMLKFLEGLHNVKELTLSHGCLQVLSAAPNLLEHQFPVFSNLRWLNLKTTCSLSTVGYLLKISPILESLVLTSMERSLLNEEDDWRASLPFPQMLLSDDLEFEPVEVRGNEFTSADDEENWEARLPLPHMSSQLKFVEIKDVQACDKEFKFLEFLFRNAMVLEELILFLCPSGNSSRKYDRIAEFSEKVKRLPRASPSVTMIFIYS